MLKFIIKTLINYKKDGEIQWWKINNRINEGFSTNYLTSLLFNHLLILVLLQCFDCSKVFLKQKKNTNSQSLIKLTQKNL
jgi:hypothetical protein